MECAPIKPRDGCSVLLVVDDYPENPFERSLQRGIDGSGLFEGYLPPLLSTHIAIRPTGRRRPATSPGMAVNPLLRTKTKN